jgi:hypothetical protein
MPVDSPGTTDTLLSKPCLCKLSKLSIDGLVVPAYILIGPGQGYVHSFLGYKPVISGRVTVYPDPA